MEWILINDRNPDKNGEYIVARKHFAGVTTVNYTTIGGWNTHIDNHGVLQNGNALSDDRFLAWMPFPEYPYELRGRGDEQW